MTPVAVLKDKPAGSGEAEKLVGPLEPVMVYEKPVPTWPDAVLALVTTGADGRVTRMVV
jgi:hypothetical protein